MKNGNCDIRYRKEDMKPVLVRRKLVSYDKEFILDTVDCDGYTYTWYQDCFFSAPQYKDGTVETDLDCYSPVDESPIRMMAEIIQAMRLLNLNEKIILSTIEGIGWYQDDFR